MVEQNNIYLGDCLEIMKDIRDKSIDMILCDLPYGTTKCKWDNIIPFKPLWEQYERIIKDNGVIALFGSEPFSSCLRMSNIKLFRYDWIWYKSYSTGYANANKRPMKKHEVISIFYKKQPIYNPQGLIPYNKKSKRGSIGEIMGKSWLETHGEYIQQYTNYPVDIIEGINKEKTGHPTGKPQELYKYLIKTYTNEGDLVLDNCCGSGTIGVAKTIGRNFIGIEKDEQYYKIACERVEKFKVS